MRTSLKVFIGSALLTVSMFVFDSFFVSLLGPFGYFGVGLIALIITAAGTVVILQSTPGVIPEGDPGYELQRIRKMLEESKK